MNANEQRVRHIEVLRGMIASRCYTQDACHAMEAGIQALAQQVPAPQPVQGEAVAWQFRYKIGATGDWSGWSTLSSGENGYRNPDHEYRPLYIQPPAPAVGDGAFDMLAHLQRQREWSERTFGPGARTAGVVDHIRKELREIEADPSDTMEWIDVVILALDGAWRAGASPQQIIDTLVAKQTKNEGRAWPDWRTMPADKAIEHDRAQDPTPAVQIAAPGDVEQRALDILSELTGRSFCYSNDGETIGVDDALEAIKAALRSQGQADAVVTDAMVERALGAFMSLDLVGRQTPTSRMRAALTAALAQQVPAERLQDVTLAERLRALHARLDAKLGAGFIDDIPGDELSAIREAAAALSVRGWLPIESAPKNRTVLAGYRNKLGNWRTVRATFYPAGTLECHPDWDDSADDEGFAPEGWYEECESSEFIQLTDEPPTHWQPLPATPPSEG